MTSTIEAVGILAPHILVHLSPLYALIIELVMLLIVTFEIL